MEWMLIGVSVVSLVIATAMSVVAWKLARDGRQRSAARVEALEEFAFGDLGEDAGGLVPALASIPPAAPARPALAMPKPPAPVAMRFTTLDAGRAMRRRRRRGTRRLRTMTRRTRSSCRRTSTRRAAAGSRSWASRR